MVYTIVCHLYAKEGKDVEEKIRSKLVEASNVYMKDAGVLNWHVMQDHQDPRKWTIVERYEKRSSLKVHVANPFYATFGAYMAPLLAKKLEIRQFNELDTSRL
ncbi:putative antibiotic biosynthesis monooxygenase protein [Phytophthora cinnamomi]|uniref:putative antibiotic biosynthesis monooxygenase protein n=1 Tax=Phytophthora cinnamomi TaxID=4785 RepID=UPI00355A12A0|nr:putative antibiotic biosynthesis monooxygenase protein [Phytophthora cinnamomi]